MTALPWITLEILALVAVATYDTGALGDITAVDNDDAKINQGVFFVEEDVMTFTADRWTICMDIDLRSYYEPMEKYRQVLVQFSTFKLQDIFILDRYVQGVVNESITQRIVEIDDIIQQLKQRLTILNSQSRKRRALLDVGGSILKFLFGTMDQVDLNSINSKIKTVDDRQERIINLLNDQITYLQTTMEEQLELKLKYADLNDKVENIHKNLHLIAGDAAAFKDKVERYLLHFFSLNVLLNNLYISVQSLREGVNQFFAALEALQDHKLSVDLLTTDDFMKILTTVQKNLPVDFTLLFPVEITTLYMHYQTVFLDAIILNESKLRIYIHLPLTTTNRRFTIFKVLQAPTLVKDNLFMYIKSSTDFLAISDDREYFMELKQRDLIHCKGNLVKICPPVSEIGRVHASTCLMAVFVGSLEKIKNLCDVVLTSNVTAKFYRGVKDDTYVYSVNREKLKFQCSNDIRLNISMYKEIRGTGYIRIPPWCKAVTDNFVILSNSEGESSPEIRRRTFVFPPMGALLSLFELPNTVAKSEENNVKMIESSIDSIYKHNIDKEGKEYEFKINSWKRQLRLIEDEENWSITRNCLVYVTATLVGAAIILLLTYVIVKKKYVTWKGVNNIAKAKAPEPLEVNVEPNVEAIF